MNLRICVASILLSCVTTAVMGQDLDVEVRIVDGTNGAPVAKLRVSVHQGKKSVDTKLTETVGVYRFKVPPGKYQIRADAWGRHSEPVYSISQSWDIEVDAKHTRFERKMERAPSVRGKVVDEQGRPVAGARFYIDLFVKDPRDVATDARGRFELFSVMGDAIPFQVSAPGFLPWKTKKDVPAGTRDFVVTLQRGVRIRGRLIPPDFTTLPAEVTVAAKDSARSYTRQKGKIAPDGTFEVSGFRPFPNAQLAVSAQGFVPTLIGKRPLEAKAPLDLGEVRLSLGTFMWIHVRKSSPGTPVGQQVAVNHTSWSFFSVYAKTDTKGVARLRVAPGEYNVHVSERFESARAKLQVTTRHVRLRLTLMRSTSLSGVLKWVGEGQAPWEKTKDRLKIAIVGSRKTEGAGTITATWEGRTRGGGDGGFGILGVDPGTWELSIVLPGRAPVRFKKVTLPENKKDRQAFELGDIPVR